MRRRLLWVSVSVLPILLWGFAGGPPAGRSGVPTEAGTCSASGCHQGTAVGTSMTIAASGGTSYTPGTAQTITVTISDTDGRSRYGFQAAARLASDPKAQAGAFGASGSGFLILCASADLTVEVEKPSAGCPANRPLEYVEHSTPSTANTFTFTWTPPASAAGDVILYAAGNAANGNGQNSGDRIHTATLTLTPAASQNRPTINSGGAVTSVNWGGSPSIVSGTWVEIYGTNLAPSTGDWGTTIGTGTAPTEIHGVSVRFGDRPAFLSFVSATQVNAQVPDGIGTGPTILTVRNANGTSDNYTIQAAAASPSFLAPPVAPFRVSNRQFVAALFPDSTNSGPFVGPASMGANFRTARAGDRITFYALGLGGVNPAQTAGQVTPSDPLKRVNNFSLTFDSTPVDVSFAGLTPGAVGLYQINAVIPNLAAGEYEIRGMVNGVAITPGVFINLR